jgi:hypothetical protein
MNTARSNFNIHFFRFSDFTKKIHGNKLCGANKSSKNIQHLHANTDTFKYIDQKKIVNIKKFDKIVKK